MKILIHPNDFLRQKALPVKDTSSVKELGESMIKEMMENNGIGLAANQVGVLKRVIVANLKSGITVMVNPQIVKKGNIVYKYEGCLSIPGVQVEVPRTNKVLLRYWRIDGKVQMKELRGIDARVVQHEVDHLNGKLIIDYGGVQ